MEPQNVVNIGSGNDKQLPGLIFIFMTLTGERIHRMGSIHNFVKYEAIGWASFDLVQRRPMTLPDHNV